METNLPQSLIKKRSRKINKIIYLVLDYQVMVQVIMAATVVTAPTMAIERLERYQASMDRR